MGTPVNIIVGSHVWVEDPQAAWIDGEVTQINGGKATIVTTSGKTVVASLASIYPKDTEAPPAGVDDMTKLAYLHEPGVLNNLACRYSLNEIYTYTGNILIAVNPFRRLPHLYDVHMMEQYKGAAFGELSPHLFAVADTCYRALINEHGSQSILVSGESGAGKTETTKMLMRYLAFMGGRSGTEGRTVEQQVLESNPVLEAFGNAKTVKNNNSSRFGKFVEIQFDKYGKISGAAVRTYLLERSRVCQVSDPERNYHCFYMLCSAPPEDAKRFKVADPRTFHYLNQTGCYEVANVDDAREYLETRNAMDVVGISQEEQDAIFRVVAAILHLGNITFAKGKEIDSSQLKDEKALFHLRTAAELLMCDEKSLQDSLCERVIVTPDGNITKPLDPENAALSRDALAKTVYSRLFDWLVDKINNSIGQDPDAKHIIGVLDIYGFESFKVNSFEQLCINFTNEKLQQHFNQHVFKMEQEDYTKEEIDWSYVEFVDNQDVLDLIEKKPGGIIALLDEACMFPKSTHETFSQKMYQTYKAHKRFSKPKLARTAFTVNHYAGDVTYQAEQFLDKNKDYVVAEHQALLNSSQCHFVANLFPPLPEESSKQSKFSSIGTRFKQQLQSLMETLNTTEPHYIRCVKPNGVLKPGIFENDNVLNQLRCGGVLEAIRISCAGYPTKRTFDEFIDRFGMLAADVIDGSDEKAACAAICDKMGLKGYQIGKTKVFLRAGQMAELDARRAEILANAARLIQRQIRTYLSRKEFIILRKATIQFQKSWRARLARRLYEQMRKEHASIRIQKYARSHSLRKSYNKVYRSALAIQVGLRTMAARNEYRHKQRTKAATIVQTEWRRHKTYSEYKRLKKVALSLQCLWRARVARKELRELKMAARDAGALREAKDKLEKRVEELSWRLELEKNMRTDLEEAKGQEIAKLQSTVQELQAKVDEALEAIIREKEAARKAIEEAPPKIVEVPVVDNTKLDELSVLNKELEEELSIFKSKAEELENRLSEVQTESEALAKDREEHLQKIGQFEEMIERMEISLSNLESENILLRKQALEISSTNDDQLQQIERLQANLSNLESENYALRQEATEVRQEATETRQEAEEARQEAAEVRQEAAEARQDAAEARQEVAEARQDATEARQEATEASSSNDDQLKQIKSLESRISELEAENQELRSQTVTSPAIVESIQPSLEKILANGYEENVERESSQVFGLHEASSTNEDELKQIKSLESRISELEAENQELRSRPIEAPAVVESIQPPLEKILENGYRGGNYQPESDQVLGLHEASSTNEDELKQIKSLESRISELEAENQELQSRPIEAPAVVESIQPPIVKIFENGNHEEHGQAQSVQVFDLHEASSTIENQLMQIKSLESRISELEAENQELRSQPIVTPAIVESIQSPILKIFENGHHEEHAQPRSVQIIENGHHDKEAKIDEEPWPISFDRSLITQTPATPIVVAPSPVTPTAALSTPLTPTAVAMTQVTPTVTAHTPITPTPFSPNSIERALFTPPPFTPVSPNQHAQSTVAPTLSKQKSLTERHQENHDLLIKCLTEYKKFDKNRPAAACIVYRALMHWHSFEAEKTNIFDRIIHTIRSSVESKENIGDLAYWLSTTSTLLYLVQNTLKASNRLTKSFSRSRTAVSLLTRMQIAQNMRCPSSLGVSRGYSGMMGKSDMLARIDAKYPALLFKQQLTACVEKIYGMIRDSLKKEIGPFLTMCIQTPRSMRARSLRALSKSIHTSSVAKQASIVHWQSIVKCFDKTLQILKENFVPLMIISKTFSQVYSYMNVQLFNSLLLRRECCSSSNGEFLKAGLQELGQWCKITGEYAGTSWEELKWIRQAVGFLVLHQKSNRSLEEVTDEICPDLNITQIYRIGTMFWDDKYGTHGLSPDVIAKMRIMTNEDSVNFPNTSFLMDDDSSIPFSVEDLSRSLVEISPSDVEVPQLLRQNSEFNFLVQNLD